MFVYPAAVTLFNLGNWLVGLLFIFVASISGIRFYINAICAIEEAGSMDIIGGANVHERWKNKARMSEIVGSITWLSQVNHRWRRGLRRIVRRIN